MQFIQSIVVLVLAMLTACGQGAGPADSSSGDSAAQQALAIYTVNYPLAWAAQELVGEAAQVHFPAPAGVDPAFWEPGLDTIAAYQQADLVLLNGANYARWLPWISLPINRLLDSSREFSDQLIEADRGPLHSHGPEGNHSHGAQAFTVWLDLGLYAQQIQAIAAALAVQLPQQADAIGARKGALLEELKVMDVALATLGQQFNGKPVLYSHPVYQYFERRYKFNGRALHWEPDAPPSQQDWHELAGLLSEHPAVVMLWEDEPLAETRDRLKSLGVEVVVFQPMGNRPQTGDFQSGMSANIDRLRELSRNYESMDSAGYSEDTQ